MANSGSLTTNYWKNSNGKTRGYKLSWTATQNDSKNQSTIKWTLETAGTCTDSVPEYSLKVTFAGKTLADRSELTKRASGVIKSGTITISHNANGTKKIGARIQAAVNQKSVNLDKRTDWQLNAIPIKATIKSSKNGVYRNGKISDLYLQYSNPAGDLASSLQVGIYFGFIAEPIDLSYRNVNKTTDGSYTFSLTNEEKEYLMNTVVGSNELKIYYAIKTVIYGKTYTSYKEAKFTVFPDEIKNTYIFSYENNEKVLAVTGDNTVLVQGVSDCFVQFSVDFTDYAFADKFVLKCGSKTYTDTRYTNAIECTIKNIESGTFNITLTDSRKNVSNFIRYCNMAPYSKPSCAITNLSKSVDGKIAFTIQGVWYPNLVATDFSKGNPAKLVYILNGVETEVPIDVLTVKNNKYSVDVEITDLDYTQEYTLKAKITDLLASFETKETVISFEPIFNWGKDYFNFNVPVTFSKGFDGKRDNKPLWNGMYYMSDAHTIYLSEPISEQLNGIVLIFSKYTGGSSKDNADFQTFFVSKYSMHAWAGCGHTFPMYSTNWKLFATKYLYIHDDRISGVAQNVESGTFNGGIAYNNKAYVLRAVLGV